MTVSIGYNWTYIRIYICHRAPKAHRACSIQCQVLQAFQEEEGRRSSFSIYFCLVTSISEPRGSKRLPKRIPQMPTSLKILIKSAANSGLEIAPKKRGPKCANRTLVNVLAQFKVPRHSTKHAEWIPKWSPQLTKQKSHKIGQSKTNENTNCN